MAGQERGRSAASGQSEPVKKYKRLLYFYLNGDLHRNLEIRRWLDEIEAWNYPQRKRVVLPYSQVRRYKEPAFTTNEVGKLLNRSRVQISKAISRGDIPKPQQTYALKVGGRDYGYKWSEKDIMAAHSYFLNVHLGRPRKDGKVKPHPIPSARELRAKIRQEEIFYIRDKDGNFMPVWDAPDL
jgi:hypothetical protein